MFITALIIYAAIYRKHKYKERERSDSSCRRNKMKISIRMMNTCGVLWG